MFPGTLPVLRRESGNKPNICRAVILSNFHVNNIMISFNLTFPCLVKGKSYALARISESGRRFHHLGLRSNYCHSYKLDRFQQTLLLDVGNARLRNLLLYTNRHSFLCAQTISQKCNDSVFFQILYLADNHKTSDFAINL